jgi:hypothetical protein
MGQYHHPVNLDKKEFIDPHKLGCGLKLLEHGGDGGVNDALALLLACSSGRGGGDYQTEGREWVGRWAGDRIAIVGDYAERDDLPVRHKAETIYDQCQPKGKYRDITDSLIPIMEREHELVYAGDGWCNRIRFWDLEGCTGSHGHGDRMICFGDHPKGREIPASKLRAALKRFMKGKNGHSREKITLAQLGLDK